MKHLLLTLFLCVTLASAAFGQNRQTSVWIDNSAGIYAKINATGLTAPRTFTLPDASGTLVVSVVGGYLPLSGGTMTGALNMGAFAISNAGTITATGFTGPLTGNASTATTLQTARLINGVSFNGSADITVAADAGTLTGTTLNSTVTGSSLTSVGTLTNLTVTNPISGSVTGSALSFTGNLAGDVTGPQGTTVVGKLLGNTIPANAAGVLTNNGSGTLSWAAAGSGSSATLMRNTGDVTDNSNAVLTNATGLSFSIGASETWAFEFKLSTNVSAGGNGIVYAITIPAGATIEGTALGTNNNSGANLEDRVNAGGTATIAFNKGAVDGYVLIQGIVANSTTAGTVQLKFAHGGNDGNTAKIYKNSYGVAYKF